MVKRFLNQIRSRVFGSPFLHAVALVGGSTVFAQLVGVAATPILSRIYTPAAFGILGVFLSILGVGSTAATLRYSQAILLPEDDDEAASAVWLSITTALAASIVLAAALFLLDGVIPTELRLPPIYTILLAVGVFAGAGIETYCTWGVRRETYKTVAWAKATEGVGKPSTQIAIGLVGGASGLGLVTGAVLGRVLSLLLFVMTYVRGSGPPASSLSWRALRRVGYRYRAFPLYAAPGALLNNMGLQTAPVVLALAFGPSVAGFFALSQRIVALPAVFLGRSVAQVYAGEAAKRARDSGDELATLFRRTWTHLLLIGLPVAAILVVGGPFLFRLAFGPEWEESGHFVRLMALMLVLQTAASPVSHTLSILERQGWYLGWSALRLALVLLSLAGSYALGWQPRAAIAAYSCAMATSYLILLVLCRLAIAKRPDTSSPSAEDGR